jgi:large subunit ribosomal protein L18
MTKSITFQKKSARKRRVKAIRKKLSGTAERPRLVVFRSINHIYAQIINDDTGQTLVSMSSKAKGEAFTGKKTEQAREVGLRLGKKAIAAGITAVCFDRAGFYYHGRVKALADAARESGLNF